MAYGLAEPESRKHRIVQAVDLNAKFSVKAEEDDERNPIMRVRTQKQLVMEQRPDSIEAALVDIGRLNLIRARLHHLGIADQHREHVDVLLMVGVHW